MIGNAARLCLMLLALAFAHAASAREVINAFQQAIVLDKDASMHVTETIDVSAEGRDIRHGIFRDFPLTFRNAAGRTATVEFAVQSVTRDGSSEEWRSESIDGGIRIYIGSADATVSPGRHEYQLTYTTHRQIRYFDDYDELNWNVTGTGWIFPILQATATVMLPDGVTQQGLDFSTGPLGAQGKNARVSEDGSDVVFETTRPLAPNEGLTIAIKLPKGAVDAPSADQERAWFLHDNSDLIIAGIGLLLVLAYYGRSWIKVGRDPERGVVVPRWDAPEGASPALVNYIDNRGLTAGGWTALSSAALNLAVNGYVVLEDLDSSIVIRQTAKAAGGKLDAGEQTLLDAIGGPDGKLVIDKAHGEEVQKTGEKFRAAIEKEHRDRYYKSNALYTVGGIALSLAVFVCIVAFGRLHENAVPLIIVPGILSVLGMMIAAFIGRSFRPSAGVVRKVFAVLVFAFIAFVAVSVVTILIATQTSSSSDLGDDLPLTVAIIGIFAANCVFFFLMGAPTALGAKMMDGIAGLRQYLTLAEGDRMNMQGAPTMSPKHFETLLPYAVALGVEKPWTKSFESWFAAAAIGGVAYAPGWYGGNFNGDSFSDRIGGFSSSMASTIASTIPAPVSSSDSAFSSGGGGSSSGGGGGGGGGGGW